MSTALKSMASRPVHDWADSSTGEVAQRLLGKMKLHQANKKLGRMPTFSLPAGRVYGCPDSTPACEAVCYAKKLVNRYPRAHLGYLENFQIAQRSDFAEVMMRVLESLPEGLLRIHVSGDFFSVRYIEDWAKALECNPHIKAFGFTRAWRNPERRRALEQSGMTRFILASIDNETEPHPKDWRVALMRPDVLLTRVQKGLVDIPQFLCDEQHPAIQRTCSECGRCPGWRLVDDQLIQLNEKVLAMPVVFAKH